MAFRCVLDALAGYEFTVASNGSDFVTIFRVGEDDDAECSYSLLVSLSPGGGAAPDEYELIFCLVEYDHLEIETRQFWCGSETRHIITSKEDRKLCLDALCTGVAQLIEEAAPKKVSMMTHTANLPPKALRKMFIILSVFEQCGFTVGQSDPYHGRSIWLMERL